MNSRRLAIAVAASCIAWVAGARATGLPSTLDRLTLIEAWRHSTLLDPAARASLQRLPSLDRRKRLDTLLAADPDDLMARWLRANAEYELDDASAALADLDRVPDSGTVADAAILGLRSEVLLDLGRATEALDASERALAADPGNEFVLPHFARAWALHLVRHDDAQALRELDKGLAQEPDEPLGLWRRGMVLRSLGQEQRALVDLQRAVALDPGRASWHLDLGDCLDSLDQDDAARAQYDEVIRLAPGYIDGWARRSRLDANQGRWDEAIADATKALALPGRPAERADAYWARAEAWWRAGDETQALADIAQGEAAAPWRAELPMLRAEIEAYRRQWASAKATLTHALTLYPRCAECLAQRAVAEARLGDREAALADARQAIELAPRSPTIRDDFALTLEVLKDYPAALEQYDTSIRLANSETAASLDKLDVTPWTGRADVHELMGDHATAIRQYTALLERLSPSEQYNVLKRRALAFVGAGDLPRAIADMRACAAIRPKDPMAHLGLGALLQRSGDDSGAADAFGASRAAREDAQAARHQAVALFVAGRVGEVAEPLRVAMKADDKRRAYDVLWLYVSRLRAHVADEAAARQELATLAPPHDPRTWPDSLVEFLQGRIDLATLQQRAGDGPADYTHGWRCEADYFAAEVELAHDRRAQALPLLAEAVRVCPATYHEARAAKAESRLQGVQAKGD